MFTIHLEEVVYFLGTIIKYLVWVMKKGQKLKDTDKNWAEKLLPEKYMLDCGGAV